MGCFLACFGYTKKRKRRKPGTKPGFAEQGHGRYVPLDSEIIVKSHSSTEKATSPGPESKERSKESTNVKVKKKVSFNLNVKAYEPIQNIEDEDTYVSCGEEETKWEYTSEETAAEATMSILRYGEYKTTPMIKSYPQNYRYQNCRDEYVEEDEIAITEDDLECDDIEENDDEEIDTDSSNESDRETSSQQECNLLNFDHRMDTESEKGPAMAYLRGERNNYVLQSHGLQDQAIDRFQTNIQFQDRSCSVLNPVQNLNQWRAVKALDKKQMKGQKENIVVNQQQQMPSVKGSYSNLSTLCPVQDLYSSQPRAQGIAVDASLSNWLPLVSSKKEIISKSSIDTAECISIPKITKLQAR